MEQARSQAGLSQRALAKRAQTSQSVVARIELGATIPTIGTLDHLLRTAGFELELSARPLAVLDRQLLDDVPRILRLSPELRLREVANLSRFAGEPLDPELLIRTLSRHGVNYVLIGALGARLFGFPRVTAAADITPSRDSANLERLAAALWELDARVFTEAVPEGLAFDCTSATLARAEMWNLITKAGRVDVAFTPSGTEDYPDLAEHAVHFEVFGVDLHVARLEDILRSKEAAWRPKDRQDALQMTEMLKRRDG